MRRSSSSLSVKAAIGEETDIETLGGAATHSEISGVTDYEMPDDATCLATVRELIAKLGPRPHFGFTRDEPVEPAFPAEELYRIVPESRQQPQQ